MSLGVARRDPLWAGEAVETLGHGLATRERAIQSGVYSLSSDAVGRLFIPVVFAFAVGLAFAAGGCATMTAPSARSYLIAVRYDVEPRFVGSERPAAISTIRRDFHAIAELGFNAVVLRHVEDADRLTMLDIARGVGLRALIPDRRFERYVSTGLLPTGCIDLSELVPALPRTLTDHSALDAFAISAGRGPNATRRAATLSTSLNMRRLRSVLLGKNSQPADTGGLMMIDAAVGDADQRGSLLQRLLSQFHAGLGLGFTSGLVVDRFRSLPGYRSVMAPAGRPFTPAQAAAIHALIARARHWGPRLSGFAAEPVASEAVGGAHVHITALIGDRRRYVLISNSQDDVYARGEVVLPGLMGGAPVGRAVEVLSSTDRTAGRVVEAQRRRVTLSVSLRPGDAALFEIFSLSR